MPTEIIKKINVQWKGWDCCLLFPIISQRTLFFFEGGGNKVYNFPVRNIKKKIVSKFYLIHFKGGWKYL